MATSDNIKQLLDHGTIELIDHMGSDLSVVNGARQSFDDKSIYHVLECPETSETTQWSKVMDCREAGCRKYNGTSLSDRDKGLINFLMRERHTSPFEQVQVQFAVRLPIFVAREWMRHRTQSFNEMSGRYTELPRLFYVPDRDQIRVQKGKPGAYYYEQMEDGMMAGRAIAAIEEASNSAFDQYEALMNAGIAKEVARLVLPVNTYTKFVVSANLLNWMRFLSLRNHPHAQYEIRVYAKAIEDMLHGLFPVSMKAFVEHGRLGQ